MLIRLCDEITAISLRGEEEETGETGCLAPEHVGGVVAGVTAAVHDVARLAQQHMTRPALDPRPAALLAPRPPAQRNSLPGEIIDRFHCFVTYTKLDHNIMI